MNQTTSFKRARSWRKPLRISQNIAISDELDKETAVFNSLPRPHVMGEGTGQEENDADLLAAEMIQPPIPRSKN